MSYSKKELALYRTSRAKETIEEAKILAKAEHWNAVANRLYYACFYIATAYLVINGISASTHSSVKSKFNNQLIKSGKVAKKYGRIYNRLFALRQDADYRDYKDVSKGNIQPLINDVINLVNKVDSMIK